MNGGQYYVGTASRVFWPIEPGTPIYAQVDSAGSHVFGAIIETHEIFHEPYNNIIGPRASSGR